MYVISACLLGRDCKYNGGNNRNEQVVRFAEGHTICEVCPETAGGLPSPRDPAEQREGRVIDRSGQDLTRAFQTGAERSLEKVLAAATACGEPLEGAILKANSPSCGVDQIYDGSFTGALIPGDGFFAAALKKRGVACCTEKTLGALSAETEKRK